MKKTILAIAALAAGMAALTAHADNWTDPATGITWTYTVSSGKASLGGGSSSSPAVPKITTGALTIPSTINGYSVTSIGKDAFYGCSGLASVTIPDSMTSIGSFAFSGCSGLTSVTIGNSVTSIDWGAFSGCSGLASVTIPNSVTIIGDSAFENCSGLTSVTIPNSVTIIGSFAFSGCSGLTSVTIGNSVTSIDWGAFSGCSGLASVTIPDSVTSIGDSAFYGCSGLTSVTIPQFVCSRRLSDVFPSAYQSITHVVLTDSVTRIGDSAFENCSGLTSVTIGNSVTSIAGWAFSNCSGLTSVTIPNGVTSIWYYAFFNCSGLTSVYYLGAPPAGIQNAVILSYGLQYYTREYGAQWRALIDASRFGGFISAESANVQIILSAIRENDPTVMDVVYKVTSSKPTVKIRALAFEDGVRSFAKVVRPETFVDGTAPANWDAVEANVEHTLSWKVSSDWATRLAKVKFEILACDGDLLPLELRTIPASDQYGKMKISWNAISESQVFDALLWLYADKDPGLTLNNGVLKNGTTQLANGDSLSSPTSFYVPNNPYTAIRYVYSKMGYSLLEGAALDYANRETRLGLSQNRLYAYKIVEGE